MSSTATTTLTVANNHFFDWLSRYDGEVGPLGVDHAKPGRKVTSVTFDAAALEDFVSDAKHYGHHEAEKLFDADYLFVIRSARANLRRIEKAGLLNFTAPEQQLEETTTTTEGTDMKKPYTLVTTNVFGHEARTEFGSKKTAVAKGEQRGESFTVLSPTGAVVHEATVEPVEEEVIERRIDAVQTARAERAEQPTAELDIRVGRKWTDIYDADGNKVAGIRTDQVDAVIAALTAAR